MAKRLSVKQKEEIIKSFYSGKTIEKLSIVFNCSKLTITRNLKKSLGEEKYKEIFNKNKSLNNMSLKKGTVVSSDSKNKDNASLKENYQELEKGDVDSQSIKQDYFSANEFIEITPLDYDMEVKPQKYLLSIPISEIDFPQVVYMIVNKNIELEIKYLKDCPDWQFLSEEELNRKTIEIYLDQKIAKKSCNKEQKVIKVPNSNVFKITAPILLNKGISQIVSEDKLITL